MRYANLKGFEKHLAAAAPQQFCHIYSILSSDDFERKQAIDCVLRHIAVPNSLVRRFSENGIEVNAIIEALNQPGLFNSQSIVVVEDCEKKLCDDLEAYFKEPLSDGYLIIGSHSKIHAKFLEAQGVILDLIDEKPWEKENRWIEQLHALAAASGKRLEGEAAQWIVKNLERDAAFLTSEMDKLLCYCAAKPTINRSDVEAVCTASRTQTLWQVAEDLVWSKTYRTGAVDVRDSSFFFALSANIRQQLLIGIKMHDLRQRQIPFAEWAPHFPRIYPKALEKKAQIAQKYGADYFRNALNRLFDIELLIKSNAAPVDAVFDLFRARL